jgi:hypothetical protein
MRAEHGASICGARVRGRDDEEERMTAMGTMEREGCPIKERSLPGVGAHDADTSSTDCCSGLARHHCRAPP